MSRDLPDSRPTSVQLPGNFRPTSGQLPTGSRETSGQLPVTFMLSSGQLMVVEVDWECLPFENTYNELCTT